MKILVIGAGAWGTALAVQAAPRHAVTLWARGEGQAQQMLDSGVNAQYLPGVALPPALGVAATPRTPSGVLHAADTANLLVLAAPVAGVREWLVALADCQKPVVWLCKGLERGALGTGSSDGASALLVHEVAFEVAPRLQVGVLSGPSFAQEVAAGLPCALVASSQHANVRGAMVQAFHAGNLRVYENDDIVGVELGGAVKNIYAIAAGLCDGLQLGHNARAALLTRAMAELARLGHAMGAQPDTVFGLSGLGDLLLTATGDLSRNRQVGLLLAKGVPLEQATASLGHVAEGVLSAPAVAARASSLGVNMPIVNAVVGILQRRLAVGSVVAALMERPLASE